MPTVTFQPSGQRVDVPEGTSLLDAALEAGESDVVCCGKVTACGLCRVAVLEGGDHLDGEGPIEAEFRARRRYLPFERLGCMAEVRGDVEIEVQR
jgi:uncharacterized 2Fe-2S/4Fe-4S cluster protein (DUF4445 family)